MSAKKVDWLDSKNFDDYCSGDVNHIAKWYGEAWKALYDDLNDKTTKQQSLKDIRRKVTG